MRCFVPDPRSANPKPFSKILNEAHLLSEMRIHKPWHKAKPYLTRPRCTSIEKSNVNIALFIFQIIYYQLGVY